MDEKFYGNCRCCLTEGFHRDAKREYFLDGAREVYYDMFVSCFNLHLCNNANNTLICSDCIQQLRAARAFRARVLDSEKKLIKAFTYKKTSILEVAPVLSKRMKTDEVEITLEDVKEAEPEDSESLLIIHQTGTKFKISKDLPSKKILKHVKPSSLKNNAYVAEKIAHITNVCTLIQNSNITPFKRKSKSGFPCYYCWRICDTLLTLREHQKTENHKENIKDILSKQSAEGLVLYVDVSDLKCTICDTNLENLNILKDHLSKEHKKEWYSNVEDRVVPFKLNEDNKFECQICKFIFETFGSIERHMNVHYRNYVCGHCGDGYVTKQRLKVHLKTVHRDGSFPCKLCQKMFNTAHKYRTHVDSVHKMVKRNKCPKCPERFAEYYKRQKHMVEVHGLAPLLYQCNVCDKSYKRKYHLSCHMKRCHLEEKEIKCQFCSYMCYTKSELTSHLVKHSNAKPFGCDVCKKAYSRQRTLKEHMRIHSNDRRFPCSVCEQAFVQKCSLKGHMKVHHPDIIS